MKTFICMFGFAVVLLSVNAMAQSIDQRYPAGDIRTLEVKQDRGNIYITGSNTDYAHLQVNKVKGGIGCMTKIQNENGVLLIKSAHALFSGFTCEVDVILELPRQVPIHADIGASTLHIKDMSGPIQLSVGAGHVEGTIASSDTNIKLGAGRINLGWSEVIKSGKVDISVGAGVVDIKFPRGTVVDQNLTNGFGVLNSKLIGDSSSHFKVEAKVGFGSISFDYL